MILTRIKALLLIAILSLFSSCSRNQALFTVDSFFEMTLIAGTSPLTVWGYQQEVIFQYTSQLAAFDTSDDEIRSINASYGVIYPKLEDNLDLSFIREIVVNVLDPDDPTVSREAFYYDQRNFNRISRIELFPSLPDIQSLVRNDRLQLEIEYIFNTPPPRTFDMVVELEFGAIAVEDP